MTIELSSLGLIDFGHRYPTLTQSDVYDFGHMRFLIHRLPFQVQIGTSQSQIGTNQKQMGT